MTFEFDLGFLGGGQLARMSIQAAQRMGLRCLSLEAGADTPAAQIAPALQGRLDDPESLAQVLRRCARVTLENEFIPAAALHQALSLAGRDPGDLIPGADTLGTIQDKLRQRQALAMAGLPSPHAVAIDDDGREAAAAIGFPMVLKARFGGYDGYGTRFARTPEEMDSHRDLWGQGGWMAEQYVDFVREVAVMVCRGADEVRCFPTVETVQVDHRCDLVFPCSCDASSVAIGAVEAVGGLGLFGVELFETVTGELLINEIAPRPHNTGHYSLDWGGLSQFEAHVRLALGFPLPDIAGRPCAMANLIGVAGAGDYRDGLRGALAAVPECHVHWYGKAEARPGRKMGHINVAGEECLPRVREARAAFMATWAP